MPHPLFAAVLSVLALCAMTAPVAAQPRAIGGPLTSGDGQYVLVSGEVIDVHKVPGDGPQATVKITHVYTGPRALKGFALFDLTADQVVSNNGGVAVPLLKVGEKGLWLMGASRSTGTLSVCGRYREGDTPNYGRQVEWAEAVEQLSALAVPKRLKLACALCGHKTPEVAQLGIEVVLGAAPADAKAGGIPEFLDGLPKNRDVTASALVRADRLLFVRDGEKWLGSEGRKALLARLTEPLTPEDATEVAKHAIASRHFRSSRGPWLTVPEVTTLLVKIATDPRQPKDARLAVITRVVEIPGNAAAGSEFTFEVLSAVVRNGAESASRLRAATGLGRFKWEGPELQALEALRRGEKDADVAAALDAAIEKGNAPPPPPRKP
ncbi:MAG TPA: hypothetical protein VGE74_09445 [Gemmata sp.]